MKTETTCDWPGCLNEMLCCTGNAGGARVCSEHFAVTNGRPGDDYTEDEVAAILAMAAAAADRRREDSGVNDWTRHSAWEFLRVVINNDAQLDESHRMKAHRALNFLRG